MRPEEAGRSWTNLELENVIDIVEFLFVPALLMGWLVMKKSIKARRSLP
jgi:hypothetical protein